MSNKLDVSTIYNLFNDSQRVDQSDLRTEQNRNLATDASIVHNHIGSGVIPNSLQSRIIFDSDNLPVDQAAILAANNFDGTGVDAHLQPSDVNLGNQLAVTLTNSMVVGRKSVKVAIIGLSFDDTVIMDRFYFYKNETQITSKHYKKVLTIFTNDFKGNNTCSNYLGGSLVIREAGAFELSLDPIMISQDVEPDLFWRDFKTSNLSISLFDTIQNGMGLEYTADALNIDVTGRPNRILNPDDVVSQVGQKFLAKTDNIQKITLLLGSDRDDTADISNIFDWSGDLIISISPLQTSISCSSDIVPELSIDFDPSPQPLAQLSYNQAALKDLGYVLTDVLQPVDFTFNATKIGTPGNISPDTYYIVTLKRSGASNIGTLLIGSGNNRTEDSRLSLFSGSSWVDVPEEDLWFQVWTDAVKFADGQGYDSGQGISLAKTIVDVTTGGTIDQQASHYSLSTSGQNVLNIAIAQATVSESQTEQDERTGNNIWTRQQLVPSFSLITQSELEDLQSVADPLILGGVKDTNPKLNATLEKTQILPGLAKDDNFCIINPDADLLSLNLLGSKLTPNVGCTLQDFKIVKATLCTDGYGDINGDGSIDDSDIAAISNLIGESVYYESTQQKIINGEFTTLEILRADVDGDGYVTSNDADLVTQYVTRQINSFPAGQSFTHLCLEVQQSVGRYDGYFDCDGYIRLDGYSGINIINPISLTPYELLYDGYNTIPEIDLDPVFQAVPFLGVSYRITPLPFWQPYLVLTSSQTREVLTAFIESAAIVQSECSTNPVVCQDLSDQDVNVDPGRTDIYVPDNLIIGKGEILRADGSNYPIDFEVKTIILQLPEIAFEEANINIFEKLVADRGDGLTRAGYVAAKYSNCSTVQDEDLALNRIRFDVSIQAISPNLDGYSDIDGYGIIVNNTVGVHIDQTTGILTLNIKDLSVDPVLLTLITKIQVNVLLKKAGWKNEVLEIDSNAIQGLIST